MKAKLEVITGPMFSGKTSELIRRIDRAEISGEEVKVFTPVDDERYGKQTIGTHNGKKVEALMVEDSRQLMEHVEESDDVVAVDEAQFFDQGLTNNLQSLAYHGHRVIAAGTDQTFRGQPFHPVSDLMAVADRVDKLLAICQQCGDPASMNQRLGPDGKPAHVDEDTVKVGGNDIYEARCRNCHVLRGV